MDLREEVKAAVPTLDPVASLPQARRSRMLRRIGIACLSLVVLLALLDWLGPRTGTAETRATPGELSVEFPQVTRRGLDSEIVVTHRRSSPSTDNVVLVVDASMYADLGLEQVIPEPLEQRTLGDRVELTFPPPPGERFVATLTGRIPTQQVLGRYDHAVHVPQGNAEALTLDLRTWVLP